MPEPRSTSSRASAKATTIARGGSPRPKATPNATAGKANAKSGTVPARANAKGGKVPAEAAKGRAKLPARAKVPAKAKAAPVRRLRSVVDDAQRDEPIIGPAVEPEDGGQIEVPRLARHQITLSDGHEVGLAVSGRGVPLVVVHGFSAEGFLYAQTLNRLVRKGFKVIALDMAGHGGTQGLPRTAGTLVEHAELLGRTLDELGITKAVLAGHSMGGRVVAELGAMRPDDTLGVLLIDAIVGDTWDRMNWWFRFSPLLLAGVGITLALDSLTTVPVLRNPRQAIKLGRLLRPTITGHLHEPWRLAGPVISMLRSGPSRNALEVLADHDVPTYAIHGDLDLAVPLQTARDAVRRANGDLVTVHRAGHSWLLKDPETLPAIVTELLQHRLGDAIRNAMSAAGAGSLDELEATLYAPDAPILALTPEATFTTIPEKHRRPRYRWSRSA